MCDQIFSMSAHLPSDNELDHLRAEVASLKEENENLRTVMIAAAEEIHEFWDAHCDEEGYGPANLMHRLERGIPAEYGYKAGDFDRLMKERDSLTQQLARLRAEDAFSQTVIAEQGRKIDELKEAFSIEVDKELAWVRKQYADLTQQLAAANGRVERQAQVITEALHELDSSAVVWDSPILRASQLLQAEVDAALSNLNEDSAG